MFIRKNIAVRLVFLMMVAPLIVVNYDTYGQNIKGTVFSDRGTPVQQATIILLKDSMRISAVQTDSMGQYQFNKVDIGRYKFRISHLGYSDWNISIPIKKDTLINFYILPISQILKEVKIDGRKPLIEQKADRIIFNVQNSLSAIGADGLEAISNAPKVKIVNDNISLIGKGNVKVMINNRLLYLSGSQLTNYLKAIPAENISKIEVITNPPAQFDAEGNYGIVNIILKRNLDEGFKGTASFSYRQSTKNGASGNTDMSYKRGKSNFRLNLTGSKGSSLIDDRSTIYYPTQTWEAKNVRHDFNEDLSLTSSWDYNLSKNNLLGITFSTGNSRPNKTEYINTFIGPPSAAIDSVINTLATTTDKSRFYTTNLNFTHLIDSLGKKLVIDGNWFNYLSDSHRPFTSLTSNLLNSGLPNSSRSYLSDSKQEVTYYTLNTGFELPYHSFTLSFGAKLSYIKNSSDIDSYTKNGDNYVIDGTNSNKFVYTDRVQALYANFNTSFKKFEFAAGIRGENAVSTGDSDNDHINNSYFKIFPTAYILYKLSDKNTFTINYGRRINRPGLFSLNPFKWYTSPYAYSEGNPFLKPSFNNNLELSYLYNGFLTTSISVSKVTDSYDQLTTVDKLSNIQVTRPENFITGYAYNYSNSISLTQLKWLESNNQVIIYYNRSETHLSSLDPVTEGWGAYFSTDNQIIFNKNRTIIGGVNYYYQFPEVSGIDHVQANQSLSLALKLLLINKKLQLAWNFSDVFKTAQSRFSSSVNGIREYYYNYYDIRKFRINIRYAFGNKKIKDVHRENSSKEERGRVY